MDDERALELPETRAFDDYNKLGPDDDANVLDDLYIECRGLEPSDPSEGHKIPAALFGGCVSTLTAYFAHIRHHKDSHAITTTSNKQGRGDPRPLTLMGHWYLA